MEPLVIEWNGTDLPHALRGLPPGQYQVEPFPESALTPEEDAGLRQALDDLDAGHNRPLEESLARARAYLADR